MKMLRQKQKQEAPIMRPCPYCDGVLESMPVAAAVLRCGKCTRALTLLELARVLLKRGRV